MDEFVTKCLDYGLVTVLLLLSHKIVRDAIHVECESQDDSSYSDVSSIGSSYWDTSSDEEKEEKGKRLYKKKKKKLFEKVEEAYDEEEKKCKETQLKVFTFSLKKWKNKARS